MASGFLIDTAHSNAANLLGLHIPYRRKGYDCRFVASFCEHFSFTLGNDGSRRGFPLEGVSETTFKELLRTINDAVERCVDGRGFDAKLVQGFNAACVSIATQDQVDVLQGYSAAVQATISAHRGLYQ